MNLLDYCLSNLKELNLYKKGVNREALYTYYIQQRLSKSFQSYNKD